MAKLGPMGAAGNAAGGMMGGGGGQPPMGNQRMPMGTPGQMGQQPMLGQQAPLPGLDTGGSGNFLTELLAKMKAGQLIPGINDSGGGGMAQPHVMPQDPARFRTMGRPLY